MYIACGSFVGTIAPRVTSPGGAAPSPSLACAIAVARLAPRSPHERVHRLPWFRREIRVSVALAIVAVALAVTACGAGSRNVATAVLPLHRDPVVALPGGPTRFDYADVDPGAHLLFVAHLGDSALIELDTRTRKVIRVIPNLPSVHGVIVVPSLHRVFATATGAAQVVTLNEDTPGRCWPRHPRVSIPTGWPTFPPPIRCGSVTSPATARRSRDHGGCQATTSTQAAVGATVVACTVRVTAVVAPDRGWPS